MTDITRIAVIGAAGWAGSHHVQAFHLGASVVALVDPRGERPAVGYRQAFRATKLADEIRIKSGERL